MADNFKFPDEVADGAMQQNGEDVEITVEGDVDVEVIDDTPSKDRGYAPAEGVEDASDEELAQYTEGVQKRLKALTHARHDERRAKETALREREELERVAHRLVEENKKLKQYVSTGEQAYAGSMKSVADAEYEMARKKFKEAHEAFDSDAILEAQSDLMKAQLKLERAANFKPSALQEEANDVQIPASTQQVSKPDEKTLRWQARNQWFGQSDQLSDEMTAVALLAHKDLVNSGIDPRSDDYFARIDARLKKRFPEFYSSEDTKPEIRKATTVVAPASRSTGSKKVRLTTTQIAIAKRLNVPLELYAKQLVAQEASNG
jgi:hypothetical protein